MGKATIVLFSDSREDERDLRAILEPDYRLCRAKRTEDAADWLRKNKKDGNAVLMDSDFLNKEETREFVRDCGNLEIPIITLIRGSAAEADWAVEKGAADVLVRPFGRAICRKRLSALLLNSKNQQEKRLDLLTGLYNKTAFYEEVENLLWQNPRQSYVLLCLDIRRFKLVNDLFGEKEGDRLLRFTGGLLESEVRGYKGTAGRLTSDIFVCCIPNIRAQCENLFYTIRDKLKEYPLNMEILVKMGFFVIEDPSLPVALMCDRAVLAVESIKGDYLKPYAIYSEELRENLLLHQQLTNDMERALQNREFKVYMQPKCDMGTGMIVGAEALVRWEHPQKGTLLPGKFIPIFEENNFIKKLDPYIWEEVCRFLKEWIGQGHTPVPVSVNISRTSLYGSDVYGTLTALAEKYEISPELLELEITESAYVRDIRHLSEVLRRLRDYGFPVLMDDFGSGYSSLSMLKDIDIDILKLDMRFLSEAKEDYYKGYKIMETVLQMAEKLSLYVIAEGVETREQVHLLLSMGCHYAQGFYYYRPMPLEEFKKMLAEGSNIDYRGLRYKIGTPAPYGELFHYDIMTNILLQNIVGGIIFFSHKDGVLKALRVNSGYYSEMECSRGEWAAYEKNFLDMICEESRENFRKMLKDCAGGEEHKGEGIIRCRHLNGDVFQVHIKLFFLTEDGESEIFYACVRNLTREKDLRIL